MRCPSPRTALLLAVCSGSTISLAQPVNDSCSNVVPVLILSGTQFLFTGDNTGGTAAGDAVPGSSTDDGFPRVWHAFVLQECGDVTIGYCGNTPAMGAVSNALLTSCPADDPVILADAQSSAICGDGNLTLTYAGLPPGTYYLPIFSVFTTLGPYQVQVSVSSCTGAPPNDECAGAYPLFIHGIGECPAAATVGSNAQCSQSSPGPSCLGSLPFQDAWYRFDAGTDTLLLIDAEAIGASEVGVEVLDSCGGTSIFCGTGTNISDTLQVEPFGQYRIRVFTQVDSGTPGSFGICLSELPEPVVCDGGTVFVQPADTTLAICKNGDPDPLAFGNTSTSMQAYVYFLCSPGDTVITALNGDSLDADTLAIGTYRIHGFSFDGIVVTPFEGLHIDSIGSSGMCSAGSTNAVTLEVSICNGADARSTNAILIAPNPADDVIWVHHWPGEPLTIVITDAAGREVIRTLAKGTTATTMIRLPADLPAGDYVLLCAGADQVARSLLILH